MRSERGIRTRGPRRIPTVVCLVALGACGGDGGNGGNGPTGPGPTPAALAFATEPRETELHQPLVVEVTILDAAGSRVPGATNAVTVTLGSNPEGATLSGATTVSAVDGVARFEDLALDRRGSDYTLVVSADGLEGAESEAFDVTFAWVEVSAGNAHTCGRTPSGVAYCWGANADGRLGDGNAGVDSDVPVAVATDLRFVQLSAGGSHTCGVTPDDRVHCWGNNDSGQLGDGREGTNSIVPRLVGNGMTLERVSAGSAYTCGLTGRPGRAFCWGGNIFGQLGDNTFEQSKDLPVAVDTELTFSLMATGIGHTCALAGTDLYCWGANSFGELGDGTFGPSREPVPVAGDHTFVEMEAGGGHTCALTVSNQAFCWGSNEFGQLGIGDFDRDTASVPVQVVGDLVFQVPSLTLGDSHTCAAGFGVGSFCWGRNLRGQLGDGSAGEDRDNPVPVAGGLELSSLDAGLVHTCGIVGAGDAFCWGGNNFGQLGNGDAGTDKVTPVQVLDPPVGRMP